MSPPPCIIRQCRKTGTHLFPSDEIRRAQWIEAVKHNIKPGLALRKYSRICSAHFRPTDFNRTPLSMLQSDIVPKTLKKTAIPSVFSWEMAHQECPSTSQDQGISTFSVKKVKKTYARTPPITFVEEQPYYLDTLENYENEDPLYVSNENEDQLYVNKDNADLSYSRNENADLDDTQENFVVEMEIDIAEELEIPSTSTIIPSTEIEKHEKSVQTEECNTHGFSVNHYKNNDKAIHFYTGLENFSKVMLVFHTLGQCAYKLNYFYDHPPQKLDALEQFFITLIILRRHKPFEEIALMYHITIKEVYNIFITWIRFMSLQWKKLDLWIDRDSVKKYMPLDFYDKYPLTRIVLDATECPIKKPKLPFAQQVTFSSYKNRNTVKALIGITPSGLISYVSPCYGGSATDRQIIERSSILSRFDYNDEIMVDKGLNVQDIFVSYGVKLNMPSFFKKGNQIGPQTLSSNRKVASKRVHIERVIGSLKTYKILTVPMNQTETILSSDIIFVCAMLYNFRSNIINKNA